MEFFEINVVHDQSEKRITTRIASYVGFIVSHASMLYVILTPH